MLHFKLKTTTKLLFADDPDHPQPKRAWNWERRLYHALFWGYNISTSLIALNKQLEPAPGVPTSTDLLVYIAGIHIITTWIAFYVIGYQVVPSFMRLLLTVRGKNEILLPNLLFVAGSWFIMLCLFNISDYYSFGYAIRHFTPVPGYITRVYTILEKGGPLGFLSDWFTYTFISGYNVSYVLLPLLLRIIREAISWGVFSISVTEKNKQLITDQLKVVEENKHLLEDQIKTLKDQINPHFLFNVFNAIYAQIHTTNAGARTLLGNLSKLMRYTLYETDDLFVSLALELDFIRNYIDIEKSRVFSPERIEITIIGDPKPYQVPPLLLVTFIENAFKHGLGNSYLEGWVRIRIVINTTKDCLETEIKNYVSPDEPSLNGTPIIDQLPKIGGLGLKNATKRLDYLFHDRYTLRVIQPENEYHVNLSIPLNRV
ncbi:sensor histidine kinase [Spirosoma endophyticum]|uniref:Histidine kinase n=1 Tax=Spirosoma endophyticum TaxID=662367 RepID=A0A1I2BDB2_9BACT|nr:histidine kinase [Spirosoma endophyticum]SFE53888.1 Histidine kinase [Spirosoma endophyticum]